MSEDTAIVTRDSRFIAATIAVVGVVSLAGAANVATLPTSRISGSLGFVVDGTSNTIQLTETTSVAICVDQIMFNVPIGSITDGTRKRSCSA